MLGDRRRKMQTRLTGVLPDSIFSLAAGGRRDE
jgi:hypothetical protein